MFQQNQVRQNVLQLSVTAICCYIPNDELFGKSTVPVTFHFQFLQLHACMRSDVNDTSSFTNWKLKLSVYSVSFLSE